MTTLLNEQGIPAADQPGTPFAKQNTGPRLLFGTVALGLIIASVAGAALTWDGSYYLYQIVDQKQVFIDHSRWTSVLLQFPTLLVSMVSRNLWLLQTIFGLSYALIPLVALALSWWFIRAKAPAMFKWAVIGIGLATLPTQIFFVGEATMALQLSWPLFLVALTGINKRQVPAIALTSIFILIVHPDAIILFGITAVLCILGGIRSQTGKKGYWIAAGVFAALSLVALVKLLELHTAYETEQISFAVLQIQYDNAVTGIPLIFTGVVWVVAALSFAIGLVTQFGNLDLAKFLKVWQTVALIVAGIGLTYWAANTHLWQKAIDFRTWALFLSLPLVALAGLDWWFNRPTPITQLVSSASPNRFFYGLTGVIFMVVLAVQSIAWVNLTSELKSTIQKEAFACVPGSSTEIASLITDTPLNHWSLTPYSLLLGGNQPDRLILSGAGCSQDNLAQGFQLTDWQWRDWSKGQIDLKPLQQTITSNEKTPPMCRYFMGDGWYAPNIDNGRWVRWNSGKGELPIYVPQDSSVVLTGLFKTISQPNTVEIRVNGVTQTKVAVNTLDFSNFGPVTLQLKQGRNTIEFISANPTGHYPNDSRNLGIAVSGLAFNGKDTGIQCTLQN